MDRTRRIDPNLVKEEGRAFATFPKLPNPSAPILGEEETWLEVAQFVKDDLEWLLSLEHHKFWSHMMFSENPRKLLVSFLKHAVPNHAKDDFLNREDIASLYGDIERLVFLVYIRLSTERESDSCYINSLGEVLYNNYLFTVPVILDLCSIYGCSNRELVKNLINTVLTFAPDFWEDFQELLPNFLQVLKVVKEKLSIGQLPKLKDQIKPESNEVRDLIYYVYDSVSTVQLFLELCPKACEMFCKSKFISEVVYFYSNVLPEVGQSDLVENTRLDLLKLVKSVFDYLYLKNKDESVDEYLTLMMELLSETLFLSDYNKLYSIEFEIESLIQTAQNVDTMKVNHILEAVSLSAGRDGYREQKDIPKKTPEVGIKLNSMTQVKLNSLITEVKDILPHLEENFIIECLKYYNNNTERVIAAVLENSLPSTLTQPQHETLNELLNDKEEIREMKDKYAEFGYVYDETYDDEYDDTYDENMAVGEADEVERNRRAFVTPRVLRPPEESGEEDEEEEEEEEEPVSRDLFIENPADIRERNEEKRRAERGRRDFVGGPRGQGQSRQVLKNREFKEKHSFIGNHNRKKQAGRKLQKGMIPS